MQHERAFKCSLNQYSEYTNAKLCKELSVPLNTYQDQDTYMYVKLFFERTIEYLSGPWLIDWLRLIVQVFHKKANIGLEQWP